MCTSEFTLKYYIVADGHYFNTVYVYSFSVTSVKIILVTPSRIKQRELSLISIKKAIRSIMRAIDEYILIDPRFL